MEPSLLSHSKLALINIYRKLKHSLIGANVEALLVNSKNGMLLVDIEDQGVGRKLVHEGEYAMDELHRLEDVVGFQTDVLIVGAHVGSLVIPLSKRCARLTAIEANPTTFRLLQTNIAINACANITAINIAASDKQESIQFVMSRANSGGSKRLPSKRKYMYFYDSPEIVNVNGAALDTLLEGKTYQVILLDIEGSEYFALKGMQSLLATAKVLFMEFVPHHLQNVSSVGVEQLMATILPHFSHVFIPSKNIRLSREQVVPVLQQMYDKGEIDNGLEFYN